MTAAPELRVASCNLLHGVDMRNGRVDVDTVLDAVAALDVDVVALQEVDRAQERSGGVDQTAALAERMAAQGVFGPALLGSPDTSWTAVGHEDPGGPAYGVALVSRH
ncbi:MAG: endonuclease, partial [Euzebyales bacterium]|nr:endonuclease [Euzebyales bacterium]